MTVVTLIVYFWAAKKYYAVLLKKGVKPIVHVLNVFTGLFTLWICSPIPWSFVLSRVQAYVPFNFPDPFISTILIINGFFVILAVSMMLAYYFKLKWHWKAVVILALYGVIYIAYKELHLLWFKNEWWFLVFSTVNIFWIYFTVVVLDNLFKSEEAIDHSV